MAPPERLRPRSVAEERLYMELHPCACGVFKLRELPHQVRRSGDELVSVFRGACAGCAAPREFVFVLPPEPPPPSASLTTCPLHPAAAPSKPERKTAATTREEAKAGIMKYLLREEWKGTIRRARCSGNQSSPYRTVKRTDTIGGCCWGVVPW